MEEKTIPAPVTEGSTGTGAEAAAEGGNGQLKVAPDLSHADTDVVTFTMERKAAQALCLFSIVGHSVLSGNPKAEESIADIDDALLQVFPTTKEQLALVNGPFTDAVTAAFVLPKASAEANLDDLLEVFTG